MSAECIIQYMYLCEGGNSGGGGESGRGNGAGWEGVECGRPLESEPCTDAGTPLVPGHRNQSIERTVHYKRVYKAVKKW